jgi:hypothetical protein
MSRTQPHVEVGITIVAAAHVEVGVIFVVSALCRGRHHRRRRNAVSRSASSLRQPRVKVGIIIAAASCQGHYRRCIPMPRWPSLPRELKEDGKMRASPWNMVVVTLHAAA